MVTADYNNNNNSNSRYNNSETVSMAVRAQNNLFKILNGYYSSRSVKCILYNIF